MSNPRQFTADEIALMRHAYEGVLAPSSVARAINASVATVRRYWVAAGWDVDQPLPPPAIVPPNSRWTPIAYTTGRGEWRQYDDAPLTIAAAQAAVDAGRGWLMQRRTSRGFDLVWQGRR